MRWTDFKIPAKQSRAKSSHDPLQDGDSGEVPTSSQGMLKCRPLKAMAQTTGQRKGTESPQLDPNMHAELIENRDSFVNY